MHDFDKVQVIITNRDVCHAIRKPSLMFYLPSSIWVNLHFLSALFHARHLRTFAPKNFSHTDFF